MNEKIRKRKKRKKRRKESGAGKMATVPQDECLLYYNNFFFFSFRSFVLSSFSSSFLLFVCRFILLNILKRVGREKDLFVLAGEIETARDEMILCASSSADLLQSEENEEEFVLRHGQRQGYRYRCLHIYRREQEKRNQRKRRRCLLSLFSLLLSHTQEHAKISSSFLYNSISSSSSFFVFLSSRRCFSLAQEDVHCEPENNASRGERGKLRKKITKEDDETKRERRRKLKESVPLLEGTYRRCVLPHSMKEGKILFCH